MDGPGLGLSFPVRTGSFSLRRKQLEAFYASLLEHFGPSNWWPAQSPFEVALGAILTQNTNWGNVEKALEALDKATELIPDAIAALPVPELESLIRPAGFFRQKSIKINNFLNLLREHGGLGKGREDMALSCFSAHETGELRELLLSVKGIGPETADCILLYALARPFFVVDAYTRRLFSRHGLVAEDCGYEELQNFFMDALPPDRVIYNEYHALIVRTGKDFCKKEKALCVQCPLRPFLEYQAD